MKKCKQENPEGQASLNMNNIKLENFESLDFKPDIRVKYESGIKLEDGLVIKCEGDEDEQYM